ncbi:MAG: hypothetical protein P9X24_03795 [Candidatus Hatepunaea meridiana]|nr:hypothetical protein [Candidatus Hatepunaea meridiana]
MLRWTTPRGHSITANSLPGLIFKYFYGKISRLYISAFRVRASAWKHPDISG